MFPNQFKRFFYFVLFFVSLYILLCASIRIKMHFWHTQPVFHIYNLKYWLNPPGIINTSPPSVNKFTNFNNNTMINIPNASATDASANHTIDTTISKICKFIRDYYIIHDDATYKPSEQDILAYLQCSNQPAFFNIYQETLLPFSVSEPEMLGVISARLLNITLVPKKKPVKFLVYYIDNLCVLPGHRQKGIAPEMIQTLHYTISRANSKVNAYMFKREGNLTAIVPLVYYDTYAFDMTNYNLEPGLNASMQVIEINVSRLNLFISFVQEQKSQFKCVILPDVSCILNLIKLNKIKIYGIFLNGELIAVYVFRIVELYYGDKKAAECITILSKCNNAKILFNGFMMSWLKISTLTHSIILIIEDTAHSNSVITALNVLTTTTALKRIFKSPTAFFLYNYATYTVKNTKSLLFY